MKSSILVNKEQHHALLRFTVTTASTQEQSKKLQKDNKIQKKQFLTNRISSFHLQKEGGRVAVVEKRYTKMMQVGEKYLYGYLVLTLYSNDKHRKKTMLTKRFCIH
jgi:hypothetical protein